MAPNDKIDKLVPRWNPKNLDAGYRYDPSQPYDRADYRRFAEARKQRDQKQKEQSASALKRTMRRVRAEMKDFFSGRNVPITWDGSSECFASLRYSEEHGGVYGLFYHGGKTPEEYFYPMSRDEAIKWFESDSVGTFFNDEVR